MTGEDIFRALSEIDDELLVRPSRTALRVRKGRRRKKVALILVAAIMIFTLCAFGYASRIDMEYEGGMVAISVYNPNIVDEYEQWSMAYLAEGYEVIQHSDTMWEVTNGHASFYLSQMLLSEDVSTEVLISEKQLILTEVQLLSNLSELTVEMLMIKKDFYWTSQKCLYSVIVVNQTGEEDELVAMIQSITP